MSPTACLPVRSIYEVHRTGTTSLREMQGFTNANIGGVECRRHDSARGDAPDEFILGGTGNVPTRGGIRAVFGIRCDAS